MALLQDSRYERWIVASAIRRRATVNLARGESIDDQFLRGTRPVRVPGARAGKDHRRRALGSGRERGGYRLSARDAHLAAGGTHDISPRESGARAPSALSRATGRREVRGGPGEGDGGGWSSAVVGSRRRRSEWRE